MWTTGPNPVDNSGPVVDIPARRPWMTGPCRWTIGASLRGRRAARAGLVHQSVHRGDTDSAPVPSTDGQRGRPRPAAARRNEAVHGVHSIMTVMTDDEDRVKIPTFERTARPVARPRSGPTRPSPAPSLGVLPDVKLSVMQENLARGLSVVSRAVSNRSLPVLTNVLLKTEDGGLKLTATNLEIGITYWVPGKIEVDGATSVPARLLTDLVNCLPGGEPIDARARRGRDAPHPEPAGSNRTSRASPADDFPTVQTAGERPDHPDPAERPPPGARRDRVRRGERRGPADPDRRPGPVRGRPAHARGRRQLPDRGEADHDPRSGRGDERRHPGPGPPRAQPASCPTPTTRSRSSWPTRGTSSCSTSRGSTSSPA